MYYVTLVIHSAITRYNNLKLNKQISKPKLKKEHISLTSHKKKQRKGLKAKKVCSISISIVARELDILAKLTCLMTLDLNSIRKNKFIDFTNREVSADW